MVMPRRTPADQLERQVGKASVHPDELDAAIF